MKTMIAVNGSARKNGNTQRLLQRALDGAASKGAKTTMVNLYDVDFKGCVGCLECKRKNGPSRGKCAVGDGLRPILKDIAQCDALVLGSPIYFGETTGAMHAFLERLIFPYLSYDTDRTPLFGRQIKTAMIFTMNVSETVLDQVGYTDRFQHYESLLERVLGPATTLISTETLQVNDYSQYHMSMFNETQRKMRHQTEFPADCGKALALGASMV